MAILTAFQNSRGMICQNLYHLNSYLRDSLWNVVYFAGVLCWYTLLAYEVFEALWKTSYLSKVLVIQIYAKEKKKKGNQDWVLDNTIKWLSPCG